jgi:hypothetical protein
LGFQTIVSSCGTPGVNWTGFAAECSQVAESHTTWPCCVTTTWTEPAPYGSVHGVPDMDTA